MLTIIHALIESNVRHKRALYKCDCGVDVIADMRNVATGHTRSCGCLRRAVTKARATTHGHKSGGKRTTTYVAWLNMKARCTDPKTKNWADYGGRGISFDSRWAGFEPFLADMGEAPPRMTLDRIDNEKGYGPGNCRWASRSTQGLNKRNNVRFEHNGKLQTLSEWSRETGIGRVTLLKRLQRGVPIALALSTAGYLRTKL